MTINYYIRFARFQYNSRLVPVPWQIFSSFGTLLSQHYSINFIWFCDRFRCYRTITNIFSQLKSFQLKECVFLGFVAHNIFPIPCNSRHTLLKHCNGLDPEDSALELAFTQSMPLLTHFPTSFQHIVSEISIYRQICHFRKPTSTSTFSFIEHVDIS